MGVPAALVCLVPPGVTQEFHRRILTLKLPIPGLLNEIALYHGAGDKRVTGQTASDAPNQLGVGVQAAKHPIHPIIVGDLPDISESKYTL